MTARLTVTCAVLALASCSERGGHGHDHGDHADHGEEHEGGHGHEAEHGHEGGHGHEGDEEGAPSVALTRWTATHELFVELDAPVAGAPVAYHAHVTRLVDHQAATSGTLTVAWERAGQAVASHLDSRVARPGIFSGRAEAPAEAGTYDLVLHYANGEERASFAAGTIAVGDAEPVASTPEPEGEISFTKEAQWQIPFATAPAAVIPLAPTLAAAGVVHASPDATAVVAAPVEGLVAWGDRWPVVGRRVARGELLATLVPAGAAADWATLHAEATTARIDRDLAKADLARLQGLEGDALVSERRLDEVEATLARAEARADAAARRASALTSSAAGAVAIRAPAAGVLVAVGAPHGASVAAGTPLLHVRTDASVLVEARVHARVDGPLRADGALSVWRGDWPAPRDLREVGATLLTEELVYDAHTLSAPLSVHVPADVGLAVGDLVELSVGVGAPEPTLAIPREAVVQLNGRPFVFVQLSGESFTRRPVELGRRDATHVAITRGLTAGERVVVRGAFDVHVASLTDALDSHRH